MALDVKLNVFEGPLDLLLHLIDKNKIDIYDIPIAMIADQYMEYLHSMEEQDLGIMSEFLVMAATLLDIKCRMLLPRETTAEGEEEDPRAELVQKLLEYKMYKAMSYELRDRMEGQDRLLYKKPTIPQEVLKYREKADPAELLSDVTLDRLHRIFEDLLRRQEDKVDPVRSRFGKIEQEEISVSDKLKELRAFAREHSTFSFRSLLKKQVSRTHLVVTFLSVLELMKTGSIHVEQESLFGDITIEVLTDPDTWEGFEDELL